MTIDEAFQHLLITDFDKLPEANRHMWKSRFLKGEMTDNEMKEILIDHGYKQNESWCKK